MNGFTETLKSLPNWQFMSEPIWRWFVFLIVISLFLNVWRGVQDHMK